MNATGLKRFHVNGRDTPPSDSSAPPYHKARFHWPRRRHDPMLVFNLSVFNSAKVRECIFNPPPQRENVWL
jgi:hypothetical protein